MCERAWWREKGKRDVEVKNEERGEGEESLHH